MNVHEEKIVRELHLMNTQITNLANAIREEPGLPEEEKTDLVWVVLKVSSHLKDAIFEISTDISRRNYEVHDDH